MQTRSLNLLGFGLLISYLWAFPFGTPVHAEIEEVVTEIQLRPYIASDPAGNLYAGTERNQVFRITPAGVMTKIFDGEANVPLLDFPLSIAVGPGENVYVGGNDTHNVYEITPGGVTTEIIDASGDGTSMLEGPRAIVVDAAGNVFVAGELSDNVFKITPGGTVTEIIDVSGDGAGNLLRFPQALAVDGIGNVYVSSQGDVPAHRVFRITPAGTISTIIDATGDGTNILRSPFGLATDAADNVYVAGASSDNVFKITPAGVVTEILDATADGAGNTLETPTDVEVDGSGNVYVSGQASDNVFKVEPGGLVSEIVDATGDGMGNMFELPLELAIDGSGNLYASTIINDTIFRLPAAGAPAVAAESVVPHDWTLVDTGTERLYFFADSGGVYELLADGSLARRLDPTGNGTGIVPQNPSAIASDAAGNVYVTGFDSDNAIKLTPAGVVTEIIDASGDGLGAALADPSDVETDSAGNVYVVGRTSDNAFKITPGGMVTEIIDASGDGAGNALSEPRQLATDAAGDVYVSGHASDNAFRVTSAGAITELIDSTGDGAGASLTGPRGMAVDSSGGVYVAGELSDNVFYVAAGGAVSRVLDQTGDGIGNTMERPVDVSLDSAGNLLLTAAGSDNAFRVSATGVATEIISRFEFDRDDRERTIIADAAGAVYVSGPENAFRITFEVAQCTAEPAADCLTGFSRTLLSLNEKKAGRESYKFKWGTPSDIGMFDKGDFGNPVDGDTSVAICLYDDAGTLTGEFLVDRAGDDCDGRPCWKSTSAGYSYKDKLSASDGIVKLRYANSSGGTKTIVVGKNNANKGQLNLATGMAAALSGSVAPTVQFRTSDEVCVDAVMNLIKADTGILYKATRK